MHITLRQLQIFTAVYRCGSVTQAAVDLCLSQSAVSTALNALEKQLGRRLFERVGRILAANEYARVLYDKAVVLLQDAQNIEALFQQDAAQLVIGASSTIGVYLLPEIIAAFKQRYPQINVILQVGNSADICRKLNDFDCDLALVEGQVSGSNLHAQVWCKDELVFFAPPQSSYIDHNTHKTGVLTPKQLAALPLIVRETGSGTRECIDSLLSQLPQCCISMELGHSEAIKQAVLHGLGVGCLSRHTVAHELSEGRFIAYRPFVPRPLYLVRHRRKQDTAALAAFVAVCCEKYG